MPSFKDYQWLWVDVQGEEQHPLYDGPHLYPLETVQVLMEEPFLVANAETLPFGWVPQRGFLSAGLADAWNCLAAMWQKDAPGVEICASAKR